MDRNEGGAATSTRGRYETEELPLNGEARTAGGEVGVNEKTGTWIPLGIGK